MRDRYKITERDGIYFITSTIVQWMPVFTTGKYFGIVLDSLKFCRDNKDLKLYAYVILDSHFHLIASAPQLSKAIMALKKFTARNIVDQLKRDNKEWLLSQLAFFKKSYKNRSDYQVWQECLHPVLLSSAEMFNQKIEYIHHNPVKRGLVELPEHWLYSSARNYILNDHSLIDVDCKLR
jgi:putative transposase